MKKNILIWGSALILLVIALFVTNGYGKNKTISTSPGQLESVPGVQKPSSAAEASANNTKTEKALDFTLKDLDGNKVSLSDFKGKSVYLNFFATWCPPCRLEMPDIEKIHQKYKDQGLVVLAVDLGEDRDTVKSYIEKGKYSFKVLLDTDQSIGIQYETSAIPVSVFIDKNGDIAAKRVGALSESEMESYVKVLLNKK